MQVAHFLEADLQPWAAALAATLFGSLDLLAAAPTDELPEASPPVWRAMTRVLVNRFKGSGAQLRGASSQAAACRQAWRHLDELAPLGDAADAVLRAWRLPLREQLPLTPAAWRPAVISSHVEGGRLALDGTEVAACSDDAMRGVHGVHSLALDLTPHACGAADLWAVQKGAHCAIASLPALRALTLCCSGSWARQHEILLQPLLNHLLTQTLPTNAAEFRGMSVDELDATTLVAPLETPSAITRLELIYRAELLLACIDIQARFVAPLAPVLSQLPRLAHLTVAGAFMGSAGAAALAAPLGRLTALTCLDLSGNAIAGAGVRALAPALSRLSQLAHLNLSGNMIADAAEAFRAALCHLPALTALDIASNCIGAHHMAALAPALSRLPRLAHLGLGGNLIGDAGAAALAQPLAALTGLTSLDLGFCISARAAASLVPALAGLSRLADLSWCHHAGGRVVPPLEVHTALTRLRLSLIHI